ncbi:hypothetical protein [Agromyces sp. NPDC058104]|uniref:hypothetical protein n=1 Tax=Agromyces sp. NPDC058104 TaxID=3346342 RepID=UPI0036DBC216
MSDIIEISVDREGGHYVSDTHVPGPKTTLSQISGVLAERVLRRVGRPAGDVTVREVETTFAYSEVTLDSRVEFTIYVDGEQVFDASGALQDQGSELTGYGAFEAWLNDVDEDVQQRRDPDEISERLGQAVVAAALAPKTTGRVGPIPDEDLRAIAYALLTAETPRDRQRRVGASNLANPCDHDLACDFAGIQRSAAQADRAWMGRVVGTAFHGVLEDREQASLDFALTGPETTVWDAPAVKWIGQSFPDMKIEEHLTLGEIEGYGPIGTTRDIGLNADHMGDWKNSTRHKSLLMIDYLRIKGFFKMPDGSAIEPYGRTHKEIKLSEREYDKAMVKQAYKLQGYYAQLLLYGLALYRRGTPVKKLSNIFLNRDGTGWFDVPTADGYDDPKRVHDIWVLSFPFNLQQAELAWNRGVSIWQHLQAGGSPADFESRDECFTCEVSGRWAPAAEVAA